MIQIEAQCI